MHIEPITYIIIGASYVSGYLLGRLLRPKKEKSEEKSEEKENSVSCGPYRTPGESTSASAEPTSAETSVKQEKLWDYESHDDKHIKVACPMCGAAVPPKACICKKVQGTKTAAHLHQRCDACGVIFAMPGWKEAQEEKQRRLREKKEAERKEAEKKGSLS